MRHSNKMALVLVATVLVGACGGGDDDIPTGPPSSPINLSGIWQFDATATGEATAWCTNSSPDVCTLHVTCTMGPSVAGRAEGVRLERFDPNCDWSTVRNDTTFRTGGTGNPWGPFIRDISVTGSSVAFNLNSASNPFEGSVTSTSMQGTLTIAEGNYILRTLYHITSPLILRGSWTAVKQ